MVPKQLPTFPIVHPKDHEPEAPEFHPRKKVGNWRKVNSQTFRLQKLHVASLLT